VDYGEAIEFLLSLSDLERGVQASANPAMSVASVRSLLSRLNDPHLGRPTIHITGSKGKGSTAAMIAGILRRNGDATALFTSPHLHSYTERIAINGEAVSPEEFAAGVEAILPAVEAERQSVHGDVSTFGVLTALFFWLVRAQLPPIKWQVVEVGLGGTFDATNVFEAPEVAVITPISLEHTAILGSTTEAIARDKAGIVKPGCTCVLAPAQDEAVREVVRARCEDVGARLVDVGALYEVQPLEKYVFGQSFHLSGPGGTRELRTPLLGRHQLDNAATAVAVIDALRERGYDIGDEALVDGLARTRVPGRLEVMGQAPLVVADGAHNGASAAALAQALRDYFEWKRCFFVIGVAQDKDVRAIGFKLARMAELIVCARYRSARSMDPYTMIQEIGFLGPAAVAEESVPAAIDTALGHAREEDVVCITGSLYVVAEAREYLLGESVVRR
jgi:dihydrofolate synthase/folylpolyglutamate synthase